MNDHSASSTAWYSGITRYQWLVLVIASLGWVFDVFEGQIFVASMNEAMPSLVPAGTPAETTRFYNDLAFVAFLLGGALGGVLFGVLADRWGRTRTMIYTIVVYSLFTFVSGFAQSWWQLVISRFFVALGVGGEWAVASALVAEVFPTRARAHSLAIFHGSSVLGTLLAVAAHEYIVNNRFFASEQYPSLPWRAGFMLGVLPALLIIWIRLSLREPERLPTSTAIAESRPGRIAELFQGNLARHTIVGVGLASVGLATFWGVHVFHRNLMQAAHDTQLLAEAAPSEPRPIAEPRKNELLAAYKTERATAANLGMLLATLGGGAGLVAFGPISERLGRRGAFLFYHLGAVVVAVGTFQSMEQTSPALLWPVLPLFGFFTLGMHAGYAVYFPELYPTRLRGTGAGFCFNFGRILAAACLGLFGLAQARWKIGFVESKTMLSLLYLLGVVLLLFAPETRGKELPE